MMVAPFWGYRLKNKNKIKKAPCISRKGDYEELHYLLNRKNDLLFLLHKEIKEKFAKNTELKGIHYFHKNIKLNRVLGNLPKNIKEYLVFFILLTNNILFFKENAS